MGANPLKVQEVTVFRRFRLGYCYAPMLRNEPGRGRP